MAQTIIGALMTIIMYIVVDMLYGVLDPRVAQIGLRLTF